MHSVAIDRIAAAARIAARVAALAGVVALALVAPASAVADSPYRSWAAIVVAGDWHAHSGAPSEAFDNARRDVAADLTDIGFAPGHVRQFSAQARRFANQDVTASDVNTISHTLSQLAHETSGGCLIYFTSHGNQQGIIVGDDLMSPSNLSHLLDATCGDRPTVIVLSACFSGVFVPALASPSRMILTASRRDRSSFGCGESDKYPYFDACFIRELPQARTFPGLAAAIQDCVADRERVTHAEPPSEPQLSVGQAIAPILRTYAFEQNVHGTCTGANSTRGPSTTC